MRPLAEITIHTDGGPWADHNFPCPVCRQNEAMVTLWNGAFQPCDVCRMNGWLTIRVPRLLRRRIKIGRFDRAE